MKMDSGKKFKSKKPIHIGWVIGVAVVIICTIISLGMIYGLATPKSEYVSQVKKINNTLDHVKDITAGMDALASYQDTKIENVDENTQIQLEHIDSRITESDTRLSDKISSVNNEINNQISGVKDEINNQINGVNTSLNTRIDEVDSRLGNNISTVNEELSRQIGTLTDLANNQMNDLRTKVVTLDTTVSASASGLVIVPSVTTTDTGGIITLEIISDIIQTLAFQVDFRPISDAVQSATMDASLAALYGSPPVTLKAGTTVRGDYTLYWGTGDSKYHLQRITFITKRTTLSQKISIKEITYTASKSYEILITPVYTTGTSTGTW